MRDEPSVESLKTPLLVTRHVHFCDAQLHIKTIIEIPSNYYGTRNVLLGDNSDCIKRT
jgi:hypothetical protein